jgi:DNA polymerase (family X)
VTTPAALLTQLADLAEIRGASDAADLRRAAAALALLAESDLARLRQSPHSTTLEILQDFPPTVQFRVSETLGAAGADTIRAALSAIPLLLRRLVELATLTTGEALLLFRQCGVATLADLELALDDGRVARLLNVSRAAALTSAAEAFAQATRPLPLGRATELLDSLGSHLTHYCPLLARLTPAGDARRFEPLVSALVVVACASDPAAAVEQIASVPAIDDVVCRTNRRTVLMWQNVEVDVRVAAAEEYGTVLFAATGARPHVKSVTERRRRRTLSAREEDVYAQAGLPFIVPELRNGTGEVEAALSGGLPDLVDRSDIRGDLHMHSTYSDGQDTVETMIAACAALGYEYIAITDHSESAAASRTVSLEQLARQGDEIERLRPRYPRLAILHGIEVDILPDGRLDIPDAILERLDIVLASLHDPAGQDPGALTRRCLKAITHPLVNIITHPANRLVGGRAGYALDFDAVFAAAVATGTALEIDGAPSHLDLDGERARAAVAAGVTVTIDSDCHRARMLDRQMRFGVGTARRGFVEKRHVLNARPVEEVRAFIRAKRSRQA